MGVLDFRVVYTTLGVGGTRYGRAHCDRPGGFASSADCLRYPPRQREVIFPHHSGPTQLGDVGARGVSDSSVGPGIGTFVFGIGVRFTR